MGRVGAVVLEAHYLALVTPEDARRFWQIVPTKKPPAG